MKSKYVSPRSSPYVQAFEENSEDSEVKALSYLMALQAFSMADPSLCVPGHDSSKFAVALHPYLKSQV